MFGIFKNSRKGNAMAQSILSLEFDEILRSEVQISVQIKMSLTRGIVHS